MTGQTINIEREVVVDYILAQASLRGDITGRGSMLNDLDHAAICCVVERQIARCAFAAGADYEPTDTGWVIDVPDGIRPAQLFEWLMSGITGVFIPSEHQPTLPTAVPPPIQPEW